MQRVPLDRPAVLLRKDHFTPEELADLLGMTVYPIRHAARMGELPATIVDHRVLCIRRDDALAWLAQRAAALPPARVSGVDPGAERI